jgi:hypothetical protein
MTQKAPFWQSLFVTSAFGFVEQLLCFLRFKGAATEFPYETKERSDGGNMPIIAPNLRSRRQIACNRMGVRLI